LTLPPSELLFGFILTFKENECKKVSIAQPKQNFIARFVRFATLFSVIVIPAEAGIQSQKKYLDSHFHGNDRKNEF